jgi:AraC-like DNA-binding protein
MAQNRGSIRRRLATPLGSGFVDVLDDLLSGTRARGGAFNLTVLDTPWGFEIVDRAPLALAMLLSGSGWIVREGGEPVRVEERDVAVLSGGDPYLVVESPHTRPTLRIHPGGRCEPLPGAPADSSLRIAPRTTGGRPDGEFQVVSGTYQRVGDVGRRLLAALPPTLVVPAADVGPVMDLVTAEIQRERLGQQSVLDRWLDLALITALRAWFEEARTSAPGWYQAQSDPCVAQTLRLIHADPAHPWSVANLASATGVSRATLSRRFTRIVGESPMAYLTGWRLTLAADQLTDSGDTLDAIARRVGYASPFALSAAFKRVRGITPSEHRRTAA